LASASSAALAQPAETRVRIGYQKYGVLLVVKGRGELDAALAAEHVKVEWAEFPGGIQLVEALQAGRIDLGVTGEAPPIFGQAAGAPLVYLAAEPAAPEAEAIVVKTSSPVHAVADLKGKKLVVNKGSNAHFLVVKALQEAGIPYSDVQVTYAPPADGRAAFEAGRVDAWAIWDPFYAVAQEAGGVRVLRDGKGLVRNTGFYVGTRTFTAAHPEIVRHFLDAIRSTDARVTAHPKEVAATLAPQLGLPEGILEKALTRSPWGVGPLTRDTQTAQQAIADAFLALKLIATPIKVSEAFPAIPASAAIPASPTISHSAEARAFATQR